MQANIRLEECNYYIRYEILIMFIYGHVYNSYATGTKLNLRLSEQSILIKKIVRY